MCSKSDMPVSSRTKSLVKESVLCCVSVYLKADVRPSTHLSKEVACVFIQIHLKKWQIPSEKAQFCYVNIKTSKRKLKDLCTEQIKVLAVVFRKIKRFLSQDVTMHFFEN